MSYSNFNLERVKHKFNLTTIEEFGIFADILPVESSELLKQILQDNLPIAIASNSEKARSEMIIAPILVELKRKFRKETYTDKAYIHTWLAWQKTPGRQLHDAIKQKFLMPTNPKAQIFVDWFKDLYDL